MLISSILFILSIVILYGGSNCAQVVYKDRDSSGSSGAVTLVTLTATNITQTTAVLNGIANANGIGTNVYFEWGKTLTYGTTTGYQYIGEGTNDINVSANLSGLTLNTTYNFRIKGLRGGTTYSGENRSFTTAGIPPTCTTNAANNITYSSARLNATVNANGLATLTYFNYGLSTSYTVTTTSQAIGSGSSNVSVSIDLSALSPSTLYYFRAVATNSSGTTYGNNLTFTTATPPAPTCTTNPATSITSSSAQLNGTVNPNGLSTDIYFEWGLNTSYGNTTTPLNIGNGTTALNVSANISGLSSATEYNFRVVGASTSGTNYGGNLTFTTP